VDAAIETFRAVVNTWECDEMGHMNVRFYVARAMDGVGSLALALGLGPRLLRASELKLVPREQHLRFHRELHPGHAVVMRGGVVRADAHELEVYQELRRAEGGTLCASITTRLTLCTSDGALQSLDERVLQSARALTVAVPEHGLPRGLLLGEPSPAMSLDDAFKLGLHGVYRGQVREEDCDRGGVMRIEAFMGRISDGVPHFFQSLGGLTRDPSQGLGGAALEYRLIYRAFPRAGDIIEIRSGLRAQRGKTTEFCNFLFDAESGACIMSSDAVAVMFDMRLRKAIAPPAEVVERLASQAIPGLKV